MTENLFEDHEKPEPLEETQEEEFFVPCSFCMIEKAEETRQISSLWTYCNYPSYHGWRDSHGHIKHRHFHPGEPQKSIKSGRSRTKAKKEIEQEKVTATPTQREIRIVNALQEIAENPNSETAKAACAAIGREEVARGIVGKDVDRLFLDIFLKMAGVLQDPDVAELIQVNITPERMKGFK